MSWKNAAERVMSWAPTEGELRESESVLANLTALWHENDKEKAKVMSVPCVSLA